MISRFKIVFLKNDPTQSIVCVNTKERKKKTFLKPQLNILLTVNNYFTIKKTPM